MKRFNADGRLRPWHVISLFAFAIAAGFGIFSLVTHRTPIALIEQAAIPPPRALFGRPSLLVLVEGLDYDYSSNDEETSAHSRSDVIMAIRLDFVHHRVYELSVPRDMVATMPDGQQAKINEAQSEGGVTEAQTVVAKWLGVPAFQRYVVLRIDTMKDLVNAIGGVSVDVETSDCLLSHTGCKGERIDYDDSWGHLHVHLIEGYQHLDGDQAVGYSRYRHDFCSDPCRIMRQQQVIRAIVAQIRKNGLATVFDVGPLVAALNKDVSTNFTAREELSIALAFSKITPRDVVTGQIPYVADVDLPGYGDSIIPDQSAKRRLVAKFLGSPGNT